MNVQQLLPKLPLIVRWIDDTLAMHATRARPVTDFGFKRLPQYYPADLLRRAKVVALPAVPAPPLTALGLPEFADFERGNYSGITFKDTYFVDENRATDESLHFHELVHVIQWQRLGVEKFLLAYAAGLISHGYRNSPLEAMAYDLQARFDRNGPPFDVVASVVGKLSEISF